MSRLMITASAVAIAIGLSFTPSTARAQDKRGWFRPEYKAVQFGKDTSSNTRILNELAAGNWEYVGRLGPRMVAFRRSFVASQRARIVGKWQPLAGKGVGAIEFTSDGGVKLTKKPDGIASIFVGIKIVIELKGNPKALAYSIPKPNQFALHTDYRKIGVEQEDLREAALWGPNGGIPGSTTAYARFTVDANVLTITRPGRKSVTLKRVK